MLKQLFQLLLVTIVDLQCLIGAEIDPDEKKPIDRNSSPIKAFADLDTYFVKKYQEMNRLTGERIKPLLVVDGFHYTLYLKNGETKAFNGLINPFNELKAVSHIGPCFFSIAFQAWQNPSDNRWKENLVEFQSLIQGALKEVDHIDWNNAAWPEEGKNLQQFMRDSLQMALGFAERIRKKGEFSKQDYQEFSQHYMHTMAATMYLADAVNTTATLEKLKQWKKELGSDVWDRLYVVIVGTKGRPTSELTVETNTSALLIASMMKPELKSHIIIMPMASSIEQIQQSLGAIVNASALAEETFSTERAKGISGLYQALKSSTVPLARENVVHLINQEIMEGHVHLPPLNILTKDKDFYQTVIQESKKNESTKTENESKK